MLIVGCCCRNRCCLCWLMLCVVVEFADCCGDDVGVVVLCADDGRCW